MSEETQSIGEPVKYRVTRNTPFIIPNELSKDSTFMLTGVSLVPDDGSPFAYTHRLDRMFVPSFDKKKEETTHILMWASRENPSDARIKVRGEADIKTKLIKIVGSGFEFVEIQVTGVTKS